MKRLLLILFSFVFTVSVTSQTLIQVGTGTAVPSVGTNPGSGANGASPYGICVGSGAMGKKLQILYTASDMNAAMTAASYAPGTSFIHSISWDISANIGTSNYSHAGYTIKMANVAQTTFATTGSAYVGAMTTVWGPTAQQHGGTGTGYLITHTLGTPFQWDGTSSLLVEVCYTISGVGLASTYGGCRRTATAGNQMIYNGGAAITCATSTYATVVAAMPNARMNVSSATPCAGTPSSSTAESDVVCLNTSTNLGLTGLTGAAGYTYLWKYSSSIGGPYAAASGTNTNSTYNTPTTLPSNPAYYICEVTCSNSGLMTASGAGTVTLNNFLNCYCTTNFSALAAAAARGLTNVNLVGNTTTINQTTTSNTTSPSPYNLYSIPTADLTAGLGYSLKTTVGTATNNLHYVAAWIDYDQDGSFGGYTSGGVYNGTGDYGVGGTILERIASAGPTTNIQSTTAFTVPAGATPGITAMRVRYRYGASLATWGSCQQLTGAATTGGAGEVEDYRVSIVGGCAEPGTGASASSAGSITSTTAALSWTSGDGTAGRVVLLKQSSAVNAAPVSGTSYTDNATFGSGTQIGTGNYVVYDGTGSSSGTISGLMPSTTYHYSIFEYNTASTCYTLTGNTGNFTTASCSPTSNANTLTYTDITDNSITANWVRGNGTDVLVVARLTANARVFPTYNTTYSANTSFGSGTGLQLTGANNFVVYNGTGTSVNITGLANLSSYTFDVYEYNASPNCYWFATPLSSAIVTLDGTLSGGCAATVVRTTGVSAYTSITPTNTLQTGNLTNIYYQGGAANTPGAGIPIGFNFVYYGTTYTTFGLSTNGYIWFGSGVPNPATIDPISNASPNLGGSGTIDGIISAMGTSVNSTWVSPSVNDIGYSVSGVSPNRILTIQWRGYTPSNAGSNFLADQNRQDFQIILNENGGSNSNQIKLSYADQTSYGVIFTTASAQVGLRGTSNASFTNRTGAANANWGSAAGVLNTSVCTIGSNNYLNSNVSLNFTQPVTTPPVVSVGSLVCPAGTITLTAPASTSYQWFESGNIIPGPGSSAQNYVASASGTYTVVTKSGTCYIESDPNPVAISCGGPVTWEGDISSDWNTPGNWSSNAVPTSASDVTINAVSGPNVYPLISIGANGVCRDLIMAASTSLSIDASKSLVVLRHINSSANAQILGNGMVHLGGSSAQTLSGNLTYPILRIDNIAGVTVSSGTQTIALALELKSGTFTTNNAVTLRSNATATAYLDNFSVGFGGILSGNITVQRYIPGGLGYRYFSSPISAVSNLNVTNIGAFVTGINGIVFDPDNTPGPGGFPTCWVYNEADPNANAQWGWVSATNSSNLLNPMQGFALNLSGNTTISLTGIPSNGVIAPIAISNTLSSAPISDGYNLIGNPYPSPISWNALRGLAANTGQFSNVIKYWSNSGQYSGQYADYNGLVGTNGGGDIIPLGQAVMIRKSSVGVGSFNLTNAARVASSSANFFETDVVPNLIKLRISGGAGNDEMAIYFASDASNTFDENQDAVKMLSGVPGVPNIFSVNTDLRLSINAMGEFTQNTEIPLGLNISAAGNYTILASDFESFESTSMIYLEDRTLGIFHNLKMQNSVSITLPNGDLSDRFYLHFGLPLQVAIQNETCLANDGSIEISNPSGQDWNVELLNSEGEIVSTSVASSNNWNSGLLAPGNYTIQLSTIDNYLVSIDVTIAQAQVLNALFDVSSSNIYELDEVQFTSTQENQQANYTWSFGDGSFQNGSATAVHAYAQAGIYEAKLVVSLEHCQEVHVQTILVELNVTGIQELDNSNIKVYPNPATDIITIELGTQTTIDWVYIYDYSGRIVQSEFVSGMLNTQKFSLPIKDLASGLYFMTLKSEQGVSAVRFNVQH